jgi:hypothetical protein
LQSDRIKRHDRIGDLGSVTCDGGQAHSNVIVGFAPGTTTPPRSPGVIEP